MGQSGNRKQPSSELMFLLSESYNLANVEIVTCFLELMTSPALDVDVLYVGEVFNPTNYCVKQCFILQINQ